MKKGLTIFIAILMIAATYSSVSAQSWTLLGSRKVNGTGVDHDEMMVTNAKGDFNAIKIMVENEGVDFEHVIVHFGNGTQEQLSIREFIPAGSETRVLDLPGHDRVIHSVDFYYRNNLATGKKGKVLLYGKR